MCDAVINGIFVLAAVLLGAAISQFASWIQFQRERVDRHLFALLDKRVQVNQEAYQLAEELKGIIHRTEDEPYVKTLQDTQDWFRSNNLYLSPAVREDFRKTIFKAGTYYLQREDFMQTLRDKGQNDEETRRKRKDLLATFDEIMMGIQKKIEEDMDKGYWGKLQS